VSNIQKEESIQDQLNIKTKTSLEIIDTYKILDYRSEYIVDLKTIGEREYSNIYGIVSIPSNFWVTDWDIITTYDRLIWVENFNDSFNYKKFMFSKNIFFKIQASSINKIGFNKPHYLIQKIAATREELLDRIYFL